MTLEPPLACMEESLDRGSSHKKCKKAWTQERADQKALHVLHNVLIKEDAEGIREFAELVDAVFIDEKVED